VLEAWKDWIVHQVGPGSVGAYANALEQIASNLAGKLPDEIDGRLISEIVKARRKQGVTDATVKRNLVALSSVANFAIDEGYWEENPVLPRLKRIKERRDPIILPRPEAVAKVIARAPGLFATMISAARHRSTPGGTGWCQAFKTLTARQSASRSSARATSYVSSTWSHSAARPFLSAYRTALLMRRYSGTATGGERYENVARRFALFTTEVAKTDPDFIRFHDLRHLHAVEWLRSGRSIYDLQHRPGHSNIKATEVYLKYLTPEEQLQAKGLLPPAGGTKSGTDGSGTGDASS
jgi:integrase/recombinase XerD